LALCCLCLVFGGVTNAQRPLIIKKFWNAVASNYEYKQMDAGMRSWLHSQAERETGTFTGALALLKNIEKEYTFQDKVFLALYCQGQKNKENLRMLLMNMCGSFSIGNPAADFVFLKYLNDPIAKKIIEKQLLEEKQRKNQEEIELKKQGEKEKSEQKNIKNEKENLVDEPIFPGGDVAYRSFLQRNLKIPDSAIDINGTIIVEFTIDTFGKVINPKIISIPLGHGLETEVLRVINLLPAWLPARKNNLPISEVKKQSFTF
ncbi:MAG TPA: energy transducer TonB, partial [Ferruginibacter sp.]|nr:energy transducer TonB [Ferruginibacter sp.]